MTSQTPQQRWDALTLEQRHYLKNFIVSNEMTHIVELKELGLIMYDEANGEWMPTMEAMACYLAGDVLNPPQV